MNVDAITIATDERGFEIILEGDFTEVCETYLRDPNASALRFNIHGVAGDLLRQAQDQIGEWHAMGESVRADHERYQRTGIVPDYVGGELAHNEEESHDETMRAAADLARKRERGE
jgi:hypothetical protein